VNKVLLKKQWLYVVMVFLCLLIGIAFFQPAQNLLKTGRIFFPDGRYLIVEIARTEEQRGLGLMYRPFFAKDNGMLFVFEQELIQKVWMKNTLIDLDVVFISELGAVVSMLKGLKPCQQAVCEVYASSQKAKYMLEVNAGLVDKTGIRVGQTLVFEGL